MGRSITNFKAREHLDALHDLLALAKGVDANKLPQHLVRELQQHAAVHRVVAELVAVLAEPDKVQPVEHLQQGVQDSCWLLYAMVVDRHQTYMHWLRVVRAGEGEGGVYNSRRIASSIHTQNGHSTS